MVVPVDPGQLGIRLPAVGQSRSVVVDGFGLNRPLLAQSLVVGLGPRCPAGLCDALTSIHR